MKPIKDYQVVVDGPDDIYPPETEIDALRAANKINRLFVDECNKHGIENTPMCVATVERSDNFTL